MEVLYWLISIAASCAILLISITVYNKSLEKQEPTGSAGSPTSSDTVGAAHAYAEILASYEANANNNYRISYLDADQDPYLINIYEGFGFAKDYTSAIGHTYCLEDVYETTRPHALANCLTCKTADFTKLVNELGESAYSLDFEETFAQMKESVGCYSCHGDTTDGSIVVTHDYMLDVTGVDASIMSCGQCHIEYYFTGEYKAVEAPYTDVAGMSPDAILAYYDALGFSDWTQASTGTGLLKAQHPEMETYLGEGSRHAGFGMTCADCHMEKLTNADGTAYNSHELISPLSSAVILETCASCHKNTDVAEKVHSIQETVTAREKEIGNHLSAFKDQLADAVASGEYSEDELNAIRTCYRNAQWYFDFCYVENAEGAHNSSLANDCLNKAQTYIDQGTALFK